MQFFRKRPRFYAYKRARNRARLLSWQLKQRHTCHSIRLSPGALATPPRSPLVYAHVGTFFFIIAPSRLLTTVPPCYTSLRNCLTVKPAPPLVRANVQSFRRDILIFNQRIFNRETRDRTNYLLCLIFVPFITTFALCFVSNGRNFQGKLFWQIWGKVDESFLIPNLEDLELNCCFWLDVHLFVGRFCGGYSP